MQLLTLLCLRIYCDRRTVFGSIHSVQDILRVLTGEHFCTIRNSENIITVKIPLCYNYSSISHVFNNFFFISAKTFSNFHYRSVLLLG